MPKGVTTFNIGSVDKIKVLVADGQRLFADVLVAALTTSPEIDVVDVPATSGLPTIKKILRSRPDVVLVDYWMHDMEGPAIVSIAGSRSPETRFIVLGSFCGSRELHSMTQAGACSFVDKGDGLDDLMDAIRSACVDQCSFSRRLEDTDLDLWQRLGTLTIRELELLQILNIKGQREAAAVHLGLKASTIRTHLNSIFKKLRCATQREALDRARRLGAVTVGTSLPEAALPSSAPSAPASDTSTVLVADSQLLFSQLLQRALAKCTDLIPLDASPASTTELIDAIERTSPDIVVLDHWLPGEPAHYVLPEILDLAPGCKVLMTSWLHRVEHIRAALESGAIGLVPKSITLEQLIGLIRHASSGPALVGGLGLAELVETLTQRDSAGNHYREVFAALTPRELQILETLQEGHPIQAAATALGISRATLYDHIHNILSKTATSGVEEVLALARRHGLPAGPGGAGLPGFNGGVECPGLDIYLWG